MYYYFSAEFDTAMRIDGKIKTLEGLICFSDLKTDVIIETLPLCLEESNKNYRLSTLLQGGRKDVAVTDLKGGYDVRFLNTYSQAEYSFLRQYKGEGVVVSVYVERGLNIAIDCYNGFIIDRLPLFTCGCEIQKITIDKVDFIAVTFDGKIIIYSIGENPKRELYGYGVLDCYSLTLTERLFDIAKHTVSYTLSYDGEKIVKSDFSIECGSQFSVDKLSDKVIPYAFLERLRLANASEYLAESLIDKQDKIKEYLGDYLGVIPPPEFRKVNEIGLIKKGGKDNLYYIDYVTLTVENKKIVNLEIIK